jgi:hypothetical protein
VGLPPIAVTAARLHQLDGYAGFTVGADPHAGWIALADAERDGHLDAWLAGFVAMHGRRNVAGAAVGAELAGAVVGPAVAAMVLDARCPDPTVGNLAVRPDTDGYLERRAVRGPTVAVLPDDPAASDPHSVVVTDLDRWWARRTSATLVPLLAAVRARAPFGLRALWGAVSDEVSRVAIRVAQLAGRDPDTAWASAERLVNALQSYAPVSLPRGLPFPVHHPSGARLFQVRGTCCLYYRSELAVADGPAGDRYCSTCPLRDDDSRRQRLCDYLDTLVVPTS